MIGSFYNGSPNFYKTTRPIAPIGTASFFAFGTNFHLMIKRCESKKDIVDSGIKLLKKGFKEKTLSAFEALTGFLYGNFVKDLKL